MKVTGVHNALPGVAGLRTAEEKVLSVDASRSFSRKLSDLSQEQQYRRAQELIARIQEQGEVVIKRADMRELQKYRRMVTELMEEAVSGAFAFQKSGRFDARGRHRVFAIVKKVNGRLDDLTQQMLSDQKDNLEMLDAIDDIRGLMVDLFL